MRRAGQADKEGQASGPSQNQHSNTAVVCHVNSYESKEKYGLYMMALRRKSGYK